ncbi:hypothetical protein C2845_PM14G10550 [Panicum miliaceum]|uniref:ABC transporter domain-containing protein n=1 Tax=Panicum miliaceum TaxID=4540 RepID=A0A3L6PM57_PANMI|nr:hypothetical protein C2845_PM14G10550 [Panicum miliaceum]
MESPRSRGLARFFRQVHALFLKNLSFQRRNVRTNAAIAAFPVLLCALLVSIQHVVDSELERPPWRCGCAGGECGIQHSTPTQALSCAVPDPEARPLTRLHRRPCNASENCPATVLLTGQNRQLAEVLGRLLFPPVPVQYALVLDASNSSDYLDELSSVVPGSNSLPAHVLFIEPGLVPQQGTFYVLQPQCLLDSRNISGNFDGIPLESGYDFLDTSKRRFHVYVWYNSSFSRDNGHHSMTVLRVARLVNMIVLAFLLASFFSSAKIATVIGYIYVFGSSLLGKALLKIFIEDATFPRMWLVIMELVPGFSLYRGVYELSEYAAAGRNMGKPGMRWADLNDPVNGMKDVFILMSTEWIILLLVAFLLDHRPEWQPLFLFGFLSTKHSSPSEKPNKLKRGSRKVHVDMTKPDVFLERKLVERLLKDMDMKNMIICHNLKKVYPGKNGNPDKHAVRGLSLALRKGQCFGMLGPNGAGKTSFINMMIGLLKPTYGTAYIHGMDLRTEMNKIYANIGVCPQHEYDHNRLSCFGTLTGREHLMFYGRMKNLTGAALTQAVEDSLKSVNLFHSGFGDKSVSKYSGGMKRRLSVAIALIGNPKVVYMDEPSTGLDSRSRNDLWSIIKRAKKDCTIILTDDGVGRAGRDSGGRVRQGGQGGPGVRRAIVVSA